MENKFYWNPETLYLFRECIRYGDDFDTIKEQVEYFVHRDCDLEDGETEEMLVKDLLNQIYQNK